MDLKIDYVHPIRRGNDRRRVPHPDALDSCRVRIYEPDDPEDHHVILVSEMLGDGWITNAMGDIVSDVVTAFSTEIEPERVVVIEHLPSECRGGDPETFDAVRFRSWRVDAVPFGRLPPRTVFSDPIWARLDRASVEALVGSAV